MKHSIGNKSKSRKLVSNDREPRSQSLPIALIEYLQPAVKFAPAFANLLRATHRLTTIRLTGALKRDWVDSHLRDYPRVYVRTIIRLLDGLSRVKSIPSLVTLELCQCPFGSIKDSGRFDRSIASRALGKITRLKVMSRDNGLESYQRIPPYRLGYKKDLLDIFQNAHHLKGLCLLINHHDNIFKDFINSPYQFEHLVQVQVRILVTEASVFGHFIAKKLPQLEMLIIGVGYVNKPGRWTEVFEVWRQRKSWMVAQGQRLKLGVFQLGRLFDGVDRAQAVPVSEITTITSQLCAVQLDASF
jgi:hypothetical protein